MFKLRVKNFLILCISLISLKSSASFGMQPSISISPNGLFEAMAVSSKFQVIIKDRLIGLPAKTISFLPGKRIIDLLFSRDSTMLSIGLSDGEIKLCDTRTGFITSTAVVSYSKILKFSIENRYVTLTLGHITKIEQQTIQFNIRDGYFEKSHIMPHTIKWLHDTTGDE